jgi:hypothetical protein
MKKRQQVHCLKIIKEVLRYWNPICVIGLANDESHIDDEYNVYATSLLSALEQGKNAIGIANHLAQVRSASIGLGSVGPSKR